MLYPGILVSKIGGIVVLRVVVPRYWGRGGYRWQGQPIGRQPGMGVARLLQRGVPLWGGERGAGLRRGVAPRGGKWGAARGERRGVPLWGGKRGADARGCGGEWHSGAASGKRTRGAASGELSR
jgi:hypothetical protein